MPKINKRSLHSFQFTAVCQFKLAGSWRESGGKKPRMLQD